MWIVNKSDEEQKLINKIRAKVFESGKFNKPVSEGNAVREALIFALQKWK